MTKTYKDLPNYGRAYPGDIKDPKLGDIVHIKKEWLNDNEPDHKMVITNVNEVSRRCYVVDLETTMILKPQHLVAYSMIERR